MATDSTCSWWICSLIRIILQFLKENSLLQTFDSLQVGLLLPSS